MISMLELYFEEVNSRAFFCQKEGRKENFNFYPAKSHCLTTQNRAEQDANRLFL